MSRTSNMSYSFGRVVTPNLSITEGFDVTVSNVTQATSITSAVALPSLSGVITTQSATLAATTFAKFNATNSLIKADSLVLANLVGGNYTTGTPSIYVDTITSGSFNVSLVNAAASGGSALTGAFKIGYQIFK
jgi:hypothetical protein